jgi:RNA polymerase sigma factor (sigma-70 family)
MKDQNALKNYFEYITLQIDSLLLAYLQATDESESQQLAAQLISEYAEPVIAGVLRYKLGISLHFASSTGDHQEAEDICSEVILELLTRLQKFKADPVQMGIKDVRSLVAVMTYHACSKYLRRKNPQRTRLKNRLRYVLTHWQDFALWQGKHKELICGLAEWQNQQKARRSARLRQLLDHPQTFKQSQLLQGEETNPVALLMTIFKWIGGPIHLNDLVEITAELWGVKDYSTDLESGVDGEASLLHHLPDTRTDVATEVEKRIYLESIWSEIRQLPEQQCIALLLNLTDATGYGVINLLRVTGIASLREIATVLNMPTEHLAEIWSDLPMEDARIATHLKVTRQQVSKLRKSAREQLVRRMGRGKKK